MESWEELECNLVKLLIFLEKLHSVAGILRSNSQTGGDTNKLPQHHHHHHPRHHHHHLHHHHHHQQISLLCSYIFITGICHGTQLTNPSHKSQLSRAINYIITISGDIFQKKMFFPAFGHKCPPRDEWISQKRGVLSLNKDSPVSIFWFASVSWSKSLRTMLESQWVTNWDFVNHFVILLQIALSMQ